MTLLGEHGLVDWTFRFDRAVRRFGSCRWRERVITLSAKLTLLNSEAQVHETLLHEIAHALTPGDQHGAKWRAACVKLGIEPRRCFSDNDVAMPARRESQYEIGCAACAWWHARHRLNTKTLVCRTCRQPVIYRERRSGRRFRLVRTGRRAVFKFVDEIPA